MQRLADTDEPILQIAYDCGFGSTSQFYELFRKRIGATPRQFRARQPRCAGGRQIAATYAIRDRHMSRILHRSPTIH